MVFLNFNSQLYLNENVSCRSELLEVNGSSENVYLPMPTNFGAFDDDIFKGHSFVAGPYDKPVSPSTEDFVDVSSEDESDGVTSSRFRGLKRAKKSPSPSHNFPNTEDGQPQQKYFDVVVSDPNVTCVRIFSEKKLPIEHVYTMF